MNEIAIKEELTGISESKAKQIRECFSPMVEMLESFEEAYKEVMAEEQSPEKSDRAKRLRLDIAKVRIEADKVRKAQKEEYLRAGNAIQGVYNILKFAVVDKEEKLKEVETHYERLEAERIAKIAEKRAAELEKYEADSEGIDLGNMAAEVWENYISGVRAKYETLKEAERKAEEERILTEKKKELETKRRIQCSRLSEFIDNFDSIVFAELSETDYKGMVDTAIEKRTEHEKKQEEIRKENDRLKKEAEKAAAEKAEHEKALQKEREERARIEREQKEKEEKAKKAEAEKAAAEEERKRKEAASPDKDKLIGYMKILIDGKDTVKSPEAKKALTSAAEILSVAANKI